MALLHQQLCQELGLDSTSWPLLHRAVLAGAAAAPMVDYLTSFFGGLGWTSATTSSSSSLKQMQHGAGLGAKRKRTSKGVQHEEGIVDCKTAWVEGLPKWPVSIAPGLDAGYDAAAHELQSAEQDWAAVVEQELRWYEQQLQHFNVRRQAQQGLGMGGQELQMQQGGAAALVDPAHGLLQVSGKSLYSARESLYQLDHA